MDTYEVAFLAYRDISDGKDQFEFMNFTTDFTKAEDFISRINSKGGGDTAEDVTGALEYVLKNASFKK